MAWKAGTPRGLALSDGSHLKADIYVFACGPWLGKLFPQTIGDLIQPTKQDIFFFGTPAGDDRFTDRHLPVWGDHRELSLRHPRQRLAADSKSPTTPAAPPSIPPTASA